MEQVDLQLEYLPSVNFALVNNGHGICQRAELRNSGHQDLHDIVVECGGEMLESYRTPFYDILRYGQSIRFQEFNIQPKVQQVAMLTEKIRTSFTVTVYCDSRREETRRIVLQKTYEIELMPYDQWLGTSVQPQYLVSFVTPNHPAVSNLIVKAAQNLKKLTGQSAFLEYQTLNANEVVKQVAAIFVTLHAEGIVYRSIPASYEQIGQRITLPDQVLSDKLGNCIELTVLFASLLEAVGINCGIVVSSGHAYLAVWLYDECCPYSVSDDPSYLEKKCSKGIDEMLVLECTKITSEKTSFEEARQAAEQHLANHAEFCLYVDVRRSRLEGVRPLPLRVERDGIWQLDLSDGVGHDKFVLDMTEHSRYDLARVMENGRQQSKMDIWERKLLDFSLRNSMLNLNLRQKAIQFISFDISKIEDQLADGKEYVIAAKPNTDQTLVGDERLMRSKLFPELKELVVSDIGHSTLHTYHAEGETNSTLRNIYRAARNAIEETGANSLYLTIGTLRWFETEHTEQARYAPLLMLPVEMVYKRGQYHIRTIDEDIMLNVTLVEFLRQYYDIEIPGLTPLPIDEKGVDVNLIFAIIRESLKNQKRWDVEEECVLGVFSFSKFLMWNDIHNHRNEMMQNDIVSSLVEQRLTWQPSPLLTDLKSTDKQMRPDGLALPVPADSSQMTAIIEAGQGHSFILYGPPGTGKSQTITNLIANALFQGKRVLFVAEKMAALSVVQSRLERIGLDPFCLEMHSNKITKRHVLDQLSKALKVTHIMPPQDYQRVADQLYEQRSKLIEYMEALHLTDPTDGFSLYDCILRYHSLDAVVLDMDTNDETLLREFRSEKMSDYERVLGERFQPVVDLVGQPSRHPLLGLNVEESDLVNATGLSDEIATTIEIVSRCSTIYAELCQADTLRQEILRDCSESLLSEDADALYHEWRSIRAKWFLPRFFAKRSFLKRMRLHCPYLIESDVDALLDKFVRYHKLHIAISALHERLRHYFCCQYQGDQMPALSDLKGHVAALERWKQNTAMARDWYHWCAYKRELSSMGLDCVARAIEMGEVAPGTLRDSVLKTIFQNKAKLKMAQSPVLRTFEGRIFDETVSYYKKLTQEFQQLCQKALYARLAARIPHVTDGIDSSSEIGFLNRNISNGGRGQSLRGLFDQIPTLLPRLCPCMLMSPMSVAQFLDLSQDKFDLVVFDEASQMPTSEAVGAIARGKALVVVGDPKQMPPTSFFSSTNVSDDEADIDDMESILEDCRALEIPSLQLNWHYRSRHESLIAFSNNEYYDGSLITFPSVDDRETKVKYVPVDGVYDKGGRRSNRKEAEAIVGEVSRRLRQPDHASHSIGIIAFSVVQQNLIDDLLQELLDNNKDLHDAAEEMYEPIFVKNLENVQGDERDIILFSIGYGPDKTGKVSMNFGPLNNAGGERRLNVAVSRARQEMMVFSTLKSSQIDLRRSKARGVEGLKHFLEYAEQQVLVQSSQSCAQSADTVIAEQIAQALVQRGHMATTNVGRSSFKVDVAVSADSKGDAYSLGLLLDGKGYFGTQTTRDREIVQTTVLEGLNWRIMRVWSTDWMNNPERVLDRIEQCLSSAPRPTVKPVERQEFDISEEELEEQGESTMCEYISYEPKGAISRKSNEKLVEEIVAVEQPVTLSYLCRQIARLRAMPRLTPTLQSEVSEHVSLYFYTQHFGESVSVWLNAQACENFEGYRQNNGRDITEIPVEEIQNAVLEAVEQQFSIQADNLRLLAARKLGFSRRGVKVEQALQQAITLLIRAGKVQETNGKLQLSE